MIRLKECQVPGMYFLSNFLPEAQCQYHNTLYTNMLYNKRS